MNIQQKFEKFKEITKEEEKIVSLIKKNVKIKKETKVLDIGSNKGKITKSVQENKKNITLVDIEEFETGAETFIMGKWEKIKLPSKYELIIASHVWGHFHHEKTLKLSFQKAFSSLEKDGTLVLCYNKNDGFIGRLINYGTKIFKDFQYDYFDENLLKNVNCKELEFKVLLKESNFEKLADLIQILLIVSDEEFQNKKQQIKEFLEKNMGKPQFEINQKVAIIKK